MNALPDGVYIDLPDESYFAQPRIGSTDLSKLHRRPADWWYGSHLNPDREPVENRARAFGSALHTLLLEGDDAYERKVVVRPATYFDPKTRQDKPWNGNATVCKDWLAEHDRPGRVLLPEADDMRVRHMAALMRHHPELGSAMADGLSELTVLWTEDGIPLRARFDKLLPTFVVDLKTFTGATIGRDTKDKCLRLIARMDYDVQRHLYDTARRRLAELVEAGAVYGGTPAQRDWLRLVAAEREWTWVWVFYQKRDDRSGFAPIVQPIACRPLDVTWETGRQKVAAAMANYRSYLDRFGTETPWAQIEPLWQPEDHEYPPWLGDVASPEHSAPAAEEAF